MKAAVISTVPTCGKTLFCEILGGLYSRSQGRDVAIFTTGNARDNIDIVSSRIYDSRLDSPQIFRAMVQNAGDDARELLNYGVQGGEEHVYIYDIIGSSMALNEQEDFLVEAINTVPVDLTLIEIHGDVKEELNERVLSTCDCCLLLTEQSHRGFRALSEMVQGFKIPTLVYNRAIVISQCDPIVASDKKMAEEMKLSVQSLYKFPRSSQVAKLAYNGELDKAAYNIIAGDHELVQFRMPMLEIMQFMFDTPTRKIIRGIDKWYK